MSNETDPKTTPATASEKLYMRLTRGPAASIAESPSKAPPKRLRHSTMRRVKQSIDLLKHALGRVKSRNSSAPIWKTRSRIVRKRD